jgi:Cu2+-exporting ATPase
VLAPIGFVLPMEVGALLMPLSTVVVALNAQLLRRLDLSPEEGAAAAGASRPVRREGAGTEPATTGHR